jgi:DNA-binding NarL/FixJ family response regulator
MGLKAAEGQADEACEGAPLKVLVADDHPLMLAGIRRTLERSEDIDVVGEAYSGPEVIRMVERRRPELVLMDLRMPGVAGSDCIAQIRNTWPKIKVVVLSASEDRPSIDGALEAGASAYILKNVTPPDLAAVLRQAASGSIFHASPVRRPTPGPGVEEPAQPSLTDRELTILDAVAAGKQTAEISKELWVSEHTIKFHLTNIYRKLGVTNRAGAVRYALQHGLVRTN